MKDREYFIAVIIASLTLYTLAYGLEENTFFTVSINSDGSAKWVVEHRYPVKTEEDIEAFRAVAAKVSAELLENSSMRLEQVVREASRILGRTMELRDFTVNHYVLPTPTGYTGVVMLEFTWTDFATVKNDKLYVGEVFVGGLSLSRGEMFTFKIPEGYVAVDYSPKPDEVSGSALVWYGPRVFAEGRPMAVLSKSVGEVSAGPADEIFIWIMVSALVGAGVLFALILYRMRDGKVSEDGFEEVLEVLRRHGGEASQSTIVAETGLSKAAVSMMLKALESSGVVVRVKKGRVKIVRLVK